MDEILKSSAGSQAQAIRERKISSRELISSHLKQIDLVNTRLNAVVHLRAEQALAEADKADAAMARGEILGLLHGVPMTIKDNLDTAGMVSTGGTQGRCAHLPEKDATVVERLRGAGAILLGKTNTPELTMAYETANLIHGVTNNPHNLALTSGGSSGGASAIVAACGSPFDIGSDTGGSIRVPSHFCGTAGLKPTTGRVPKTGHILPLGSVADSMTVLGPIARSVEDLELLLGIISGQDFTDSSVVPVPLRDSKDVSMKGLRVGFFTDIGDIRCDPEIAKITNETAGILSRAGAEIRECSPPLLEKAFELTIGLWTADGGDGFSKTLEAAGTRNIHPFMQTVLVVCKAGGKSGAEFNALLVAWEQFRSRMLSFIRGYDLILCPVLPFPALAHGKTFEDAVFPSFCYTMVFNLTGWPVAVVRAGTTTGNLPIGIQLVGRPWREDIALAAARLVESSVGSYPVPRL